MPTATMDQVEELVTEGWGLNGRILAREERSTKMQRIGTVVVQITMKWKR
jgi:hypothetical protein